MGILDELSSATGDKGSNREMVKQCLKTPPLLHTIAEGLRTGTPKAKVDCAQVLAEVASRNPALLGDLVSDFLDASRSTSKIVARLALTGLARITPVRPAEIFAERESLLQQARQSGPPGLAAASVLAALCAQNTNYRGKLLGPTLRLLEGVSDGDLPRWVEALAPAVRGSADSVRRLQAVLAPRLEGLPEPASKKLSRLLRKLF